MWYHGASSEVVIPALIDGYSVSSINEDILYDFENISSIHIPSSVTSIGDDIFYFCDGIVIHCNPDSYARKYAADNNILWKTNGNRDATGEWEYELLDDNTVKITVYYGNTSKLVIPEKIDGYTVSDIGKYAFYTCQQTGFIEIPESIKCIEEDNAGNREFKSAKESLWQIINDIEMPEVKEFINEFLPAYGRTLDELCKGE